MRLSGIALAKSYARSYVRVYLLRGRIIKAPCYVCAAAQKLEAHHEDYSRPLLVVWLCLTHHRMVTQRKLCLIGTLEQESGIRGVESPIPPRAAQVKLLVAVRKTVTGHPDMPTEAELRADLRNLTRKQMLYRILKEELMARGWWKNQKRGRHKPKKG